MPPVMESPRYMVRAAIAAVTEVRHHMSATETEAPTSGAVRTSDLLIAGEPVAARDGRYFHTTEALTGEPIARVAAASVEDVNLAVEAGGGAPGGGGGPPPALGEWPSPPPAARRSVLERAAVLLGERTDDIVATMSREMGATLPW